MSTILGTFETNAATLINAMTDSTYNLNWGQTNQEDNALIDWVKYDAVAQLFFESEENIDEIDGAHANAYSNIATFNIHVRIKNTSEADQPAATQRQRFYSALDDLKKLFGTDYHVNDSGIQQIMYSGYEIDNKRNHDVFMPHEMTTQWKVYYAQDRQTPSSVASI